MHNEKVKEYLQRREVIVAGFLHGILYHKTKNISKRSFTDLPGVPWDRVLAILAPKCSGL